MRVLLLLIISVCGVYADEVLVQMNVNKPINVISDRFLSFFVDPRIIIENLNKNNSERLSAFASQLGQAYLKLSTVPITAIECSEILKSKHDEELQDWKSFHEWLRSIDWIPVIPLPYNPNDWESVAALRILNASSTVGLEKCVWQLGSDFDAIGAASYVADLITLQTMVDAFKSLVEGWGVIGADISSGSDIEETKLYSDLTKHIVDAIGWMQPPETNVPETQTSIVYDSDFALKALLARRTPVWLSIASNPNKRTDSWPGISTAHGLQWARTLGDAARTGFSVIYMPLSSKDLFEENLSYFASLIFKQIMGNKVFDARVIGGSRFISHVYCHCTKDKPGSISIMAVNIGENRHKIVTKMNSKFTGPELWQYILTSNNKTTYLNGAEVYFNSTMEPFVKVKHPTRPITLMLPPMSIGFWVLPLANNNECLTEAEGVDERKRYMRIRTSSDLLLQHLIEENAASKNRNTYKQEEISQNHSEIKENIMKPTDSDELSSNDSKRRRRRSVSQSNNANEEQSSRKKRQFDITHLPAATENQITEIRSHARIPNLFEIQNHAKSAGKKSFTKKVEFPSDDIYFEVLNGPTALKHNYDNVDYKIRSQLQSSEETLENSQTPDIFYEIYQIGHKNPVDTYEANKPENRNNYLNVVQLQKSPSHTDCGYYAGSLSEFNHMKLEEIFKKSASHSRARRSVRSKRKNVRNRRSPMYKSFSMTNFITKDMEDDDAPPRRYFTYALNKNVVRPVNFNDPSWQDKIPLDSDNDGTKNLIGRYEEDTIKNDETRNATDSTPDEHSPKFMMLFSENVSKFMKMLNHHVSGWWNTWA